MKVQSNSICFGTNGLTKARLKDLAASSKCTIEPCTCRVPHFGVFVAFPFWFFIESVSSELLTYPSKAAKTVTFRHWGADLKLSAFWNYGQQFPNRRACLSSRKSFLVFFETLRLEPLAAFILHKK
jgi:hypothetical protein